MKIPKGQKIKIPGTDAQGDFVDLPQTPIPEGVKKPFQVGKIVATVDGKKQPLRKLRPYTSMILRVPGELKPEAQIVLQCLFLCFDKQGHVSEGLIGDLIWGFAQAAPPIPHELTLNGLAALEKDGYVKFQAPDNAFVSLDSTQAEKSFVRYQPKLLNMIYEGPL